MSDQTPRLTVEELEDLRCATLYSNVAGDYPAEMTSRLRAYTNEPDGGLINLIDMATGMARDLEKYTAAVFHESRNVDRKGAFVNDATGRFRTSEWSQTIMEAAKVMYQRLRLGDPDLPKWSKLSADATDHYCIAAQKCIETFHYEASKNVETWVSYG